jgi:hypothetical protein
MEPSGSIKGGEFLDQLSDCQVLKKALLFVVSYEGCLQSSWTHLITPSRNFMEVR